MRTSNKILLGTFVAILFIVTAIHAALYTKYKRNDYITMTSLHKERYSTHDLKNVQSVSITGLQNVTIIPSDTAKMEVEKNDEGDRLHYTFNNGVLTIKGDTTITRNNNEPERRKSYQDVVIYLPAQQHIQADFCEVTIHGSRTASTASSLTIDLTETSLHLGEESRDIDKTTSAFNSINVTKTKDCSIDIIGLVSVKDLILNLGNSTFEDGNLSCDSLSINADNASSVKLTGKNLAKTKFVSKP